MCRIICKINDWFTTYILIQTVYILIQTVDSLFHDVEGKSLVKPILDLRSHILLCLYCINKVKYVSPIGPI